MKAIDDAQVEPKLDQLPVFVRSGSILPMQPLVQSTDEVPNGPLGASRLSGVKVQRFGLR